ncbi:MAG: TolC family protein [Colwellia sp.]|nr:TolC family protein [Colwellia sp.]
MFISFSIQQRNFPKLGLVYISSIIVLALLSLTITSSSASANEVLTFERAIKQAQQNDPWLTGNQHKQNSLIALSRAANTLPDPKMSLSIANLPTNGFDFSQEAMTQFKVGITQMFPRGNTLEIKDHQLKLQSQAYPFQRQDRQAKVAVTVGSLWLDAYRVQQSIALIERNRSLFEQLVDVAQASYSSTLGKTRQQDIIRAQLELTRLDDQLDQLAQQKNRFEGQLFQWLNNYLIEQNKAENHNEILALHNINLGEKLVAIDLSHANLVYAKQWQKPEQLVRYFAQHPAVMAMDKKIQATQKGVNLAEQKYQPEWGVNASYGYRDDDPMGNSRADFMSIGVTFDLPIFTENKQDQEVKSAISQTEAVKTDKILLLRQLLGAYSSSKGRLLRLNDRESLYRSKLLPLTHDQAEASLTAYTNDDGDFSEVVRARIAVLNAEIDQLTIEVEQQKIILELNYLFVGSLATTFNQSNTHAGAVK